MRPFPAVTRGGSWPLGHVHSVGSYSFQWTRRRRRTGERHNSNRARHKHESWIGHIFYLKRNPWLTCSSPTTHSTSVCECGNKSGDLGRIKISAMFADCSIELSDGVYLWSRYKEPNLAVDQLRQREKWLHHCQLNWAESLTPQDSALSAQHWYEASQSREWWQWLSVIVIGSTWAPTSTDWHKWQVTTRLRASGVFKSGFSLAPKNACPMYHLRFYYNWFKNLLGAFVQSSDCLLVDPIQVCKYLWYTKFGSGFRQWHCLVTAMSRKLPVACTGPTMVITELGVGQVGLSFWMSRIVVSAPISKSAAWA